MKLSSNVQHVFECYGKIATGHTLHSYTSKSVLNHHSMCYCNEYTVLVLLCRLEREWSIIIAGHTNYTTYTQDTITSLSPFQLKQKCNDDHSKMQSLLPDMLEGHGIPEFVISAVYNPRLVLGLSLSI